MKSPLIFCDPPTKFLILFLAGVGMPPFRQSANWVWNRGAEAKIKHTVASGKIEHTLPGAPGVFRDFLADLESAGGSIAWQLVGHGNYFGTRLWGMNNWRRSRKPDAMMVKIRGIAQT